MKRPAGGYTFIEVMMVLAISTLLFTGAFIVFTGQQRGTAFSQAMEDLSSKIQTYVAQIDAGNFSQLENYTCRVAGTPPRAELSLGSSSIGSNEDCIVLGRALHITPNESKIYIYTVLGSRTQENGDIASTTEQANPKPAMLDDGVTWTLVDEYDVNNGAIITSSTVDGGTAFYDMVGIYNSLQGDAPSSGGAASSLIIKAYPTPGTPKSTTAQRCIEENASVCGTISRVKTWNLCVKSSGGERTSELSIIAQPTGISTKINDKVCS